MANKTQLLPAHSLGKSMLLTLPMLLWALLMMSRIMLQTRTSARVAGAVTLLFCVSLFFLMMRTGETYRFRRWFFVVLGFLFPVGFIWELIHVRGSMAISMEQMLGGNTPFCYMVIPMILLPAAFTRTIIFPGSILPTATNDKSIAIMIALWFAATLVLGKAWCAYGCFFGGIEEGFASVAKKARIRKLDPHWKWMPWAVLAAIVLLSAALFEPVYCTWLCPFKTVTEYVQVRNFETGLQALIFVGLFFGLVVVLPILTKKRTQCAFFCPFGAFQAIFNKIHIFEIKVHRERCNDCVSCQNACPTLALNRESIQQGKTLLECMKCGACVDVCPRGASYWHIKGTPADAKPERARLMFLYAAWAIATMFGGSIIAGTVDKLVGLVI